MALTAKFLADFSDFQAEVQKAQTSLKFFQTSSDDATKALNRTAEAFSGRKIIQEATIAVEAVNRIGGVTKLTESEQTQLNRLVTEAIAKYGALGGEAPGEMLKIAEATRQAERAITSTSTQTSNWKSTLTGLAGALGVTFSAGAVIAFGRHVFDTASQIHDLASAIGVSVEATQRYKFAAEQSGATIDDVGRAINNMNKSLAAPGGGTADALKAAGLSFEEIRNMRPEDAFNAITEAVKQIPDPILQAKVGTELFGKSWLALAPGIKEGFVGIGKGASVMSDDTVRSLEAAQDAWGKLADRVTILSGSIIASTVNAATQATSSWKDFIMFTDNAIKQGIGGAMAFADAQAQAAAAAGTSRDINLTLPPVIKSYAEQLRAAQEELSRLTSAQANEIRTAERLGVSAQEIAAKFGLSDAALRLFNERLQAHHAVVQKVTDTTARSTRVLLDWKDGISAVGEEVKLDTSLIRDLTIAFREGTDGLSQLGFKAESGFEVFSQKAKVSRDYTDDLARALAELAQISGDTFGGLVRGMATFASALSTTKKGLDTFGAALKVFRSGEIFEGILGMTTGILGIASAAIQAGKAIAGLFDRNKGRDLVEAFAGEHGGFDRLHKELNQLGAEGERLWIKLTQGVGRNNPDQARAAIEEVTAALKGQVGALDDTADAANDVLGALTRIGNVQIAPKHIKVYHDDDAGNAIPMAGGGDFLVTRPTLFLAGEAGPERASFSGAGRTSGGGAGEVTVPITLQMDGDVLLETFVRVAKRKGWAR